MITKDYLLKNGFEFCNITEFNEKDMTEMEKVVRSQGGYVNIRFKGDEPISLYVYTQDENKNPRKVVLNGVKVTDEDFQMAMKLCRINS